MIIQYLWRSQLEVLRANNGLSELPPQAQTDASLQSIVSPSPLLSKEEITFLMGESQRCEVESLHRDTRRGPN